MKKLFIFLLFPLIAFSQSHFEYSRTNTVTQVGDTLIVKFEYFKGTDADGNLMPDATLTQFDFQYNNKLLAYVTHDWNVSSTSAQKARNSWNGYKFNVDTNKETLDYDGQYVSWLAGSAAYASNADWTVERITIQDAIGYGADTDYHRFVTYKFKIKDKASSSYTDYTEILNGNWANYKEADGAQIDVTKGAAAHKLSLTGIQGGDAGDVTISVSSNVITNNIGDGADFGYTIYTQAQFDAGLDANSTPVASGTFDTAGDATVQGLENDVQYVVFIHIDSQKEYLDQAVTVADLALIFQEAIGAGSTPNGSSTTYDYHIQKVLGNVTGNTGTDFQDSYEVLAYLQGVDSGNTNYISKTGNAYNVSGKKSTFGNTNESGVVVFNPAITPTDSNKSFQFAHALAGDVNFSHGFEPTSTSAGIATQATARSMRVMGAKYQAEVSNLDLVAQIVDGQVEFSININTPDMIGAQFNIEFDTTKLVLENVIFDTGNEMTNFSNVKQAEGKVNIGSFDQNFQHTVKNGTPYKLVFTPTQQLSNVLGLITFKVTEGVKADGTQIKFNIN